MAQRAWKCRYCGVISTLEKHSHRCMTADVLSYRESSKKRRIQKQMEWTPEMTELAEYAKKSAVRQVKSFIDDVLSMVRPDE